MRDCAAGLCGGTCVRRQQGVGDLLPGQTRLRVPLGRNLDRVIPTNALATDEAETGVAELFTCDRLSVLSTSAIGRWKTVTRTASPNESVAVGADLDAIVTDAYVARYRGNIATRNAAAVAVVIADFALDLWLLVPSALTVDQFPVVLGTTAVRSSSLRRAKAAGNPGSDQVLCVLVCSAGNRTRSFFHRRSLRDLLWPTRNK